MQQRCQMQQHLENDKRLASWCLMSNTAHVAAAAAAFQESRHATEYTLVVAQRELPYGLVQSAGNQRVKTGNHRK
jgi:hypothetical protein